MRKVVAGCCATALALTVLAEAPDAQNLPRLARADVAGAGASIGLTVEEVQEGSKAGVTSGALVTQVGVSSPAERAGIKTGDVVVEFDGERVRSARQFARLMQETPPNRAVEVVIVRDGSRRLLKLTTEASRAATVFVTPNIATAIAPRFYTDSNTLNWGQYFAPAGGRLGAAVMALDEQLATYFGVSDGVLVTSVGADSPAARAGLKAGDVIIEAAGRRVAEPSEVTDAIRSAQPGSSLDLRIMRDKKEQTLKVPVPEPPRPRYQFETNRNSI
jgi:serine protease Do